MSYITTLYTSHCFQGTHTVQSGTFNCAFQSTLHRL